MALRHPARNFAKNTILTVNYTGNKVQHTQAGVAFQGVNLNPSNPNTNVNRILSPGSPYQNENYLPNVLFSKYSALQAQLRRNYQHLTLEANYTWSHEIDDEVNVFAGFSDPFKPSLDTGSGDWDTRHNFTVSALYDLPLLKGHSRLEQETLGGWQLSSIIQTRTGLAQNVEVTNGFFGNYMRPNRNASVPLKVPNASWPNSSYNIDAFALEPGFDGVWGDPTTLGDIGRNYIRGPGFFQWDFSTMKNFVITDKLKMQFRADIFNILNHPNFSNIDTGICSAGILSQRHVGGLHAQHTLSRKQRSVERIRSCKRNHSRRRHKPNWQWNCASNAILCQVPVLKRGIPSAAGCHYAGRAEFLSTATSVLFAVAKQAIFLADSAVLSLSLKARYAEQANTRIGSMDGNFVFGLCVSAAGICLGGQQT